jgi:hypothetical protein
MTNIQPDGASAALAEILARDQANGVDVFDDGRQPRRAPGPPVEVPPLLPPMIPPPDWRAEEADAARRKKAEE